MIQKKYRANIRFFLHLIKKKCIIGVYKPHWGQMTTVKTTRKNGKPLISDDQFCKILAQIETDIGLHTALKTVKIGSKTWSTFLADPENERRYAQAKEVAIENEIDGIHELEARCLEEIKACNPKIANAIQASYRTQIDTLKWIASKLKPKKYGERLSVDADTTLRVTIVDSNGKKIAI